MRRFARWLMVGLGVAIAAAPATAREPARAAVWLAPTLVRDAQTLFVDYDTQFGPGDGDTLSWRGARALDHRP